jgi:hypothetical protein
MHDRRQRWLPAEFVLTWHAPVVCIQTASQQRLAAVDQIWTNLLTSRHLPCTGQGFLTASGAVSPKID